MSLKEEPRGKDLRWRPHSVYRELANVHSAFRYAQRMSEQMDDEHGEDMADEIRLTLERVDGEFQHVRELLEQLTVKQRDVRKRNEQG